MNSMCVSFDAIRAVLEHHGRNQIPEAELGETPGSSHKSMCPMAVPSGIAGDLRAWKRSPETRRSLSKDLESLPSALKFAETPSEPQPAFISPAGSRTRQRMKMVHYETRAVHFIIPRIFGVGEA